MNTRHPARLAFGLCLITCAVNLQAPLYTAYAQLAGQGAAATATAFSAYVLGCCRCCWRWAACRTGWGASP